MDEFLKRRRVDSGKYNFLSLRGGKYNIPNDPKIKKRFWKLFTEQCPPKTSLAFRIDPHDHMPLVFDFDIKMTENEPIPDSSYHTLVCTLTEQIVRLTRIPNLIIVASRKIDATKGFFKDEKCVKHGMHVLCQGVYVTRLKAKEIRDTFYQTEEYRDFAEEYKVLEPPIDDSVMPIGKNGLVLISDRKPGRTSGYHIFFYGETDGLDWKKNELLSVEQGTEFLRAHASELYEFVFERQFWPEIGYAEKVRNVVSTVTRTKNEEFSLVKFLEATSGWKPVYDDYIKIIWYLASIHFPREQVVELCNAAWNPTKPNETANFMENVTVFDVTRGSVVRYLQERATKPWDERDIFGEEAKELYFNELQKFSVAHNLSWKLQDVRDALQNTFSFIWGKKLRCSSTRSNFFNERMISNKLIFASQG